MKLLWSNCNLPLSTIIQLATGQKESHFSIVFNDKLVIQSNLYGVGLAWFNSFRKKHNIINEITVICPLEKEEEVFSNIMDQFDGKNYDFFALLYFGWSILKNRIFHTPMPKVNKWGRADWYLCNEIYACLPSWLVPKIEMDMVTPGDLYKLISAFHLDKAQASEEQEDEAERMQHGHLGKRTILIQ